MKLPSPVLRARGLTRFYLDMKVSILFAVEDPGGENLSFPFDIHFKTPRKPSSAATRASATMASTASTESSAVTEALFRSPT